MLSGCTGGDGEGARRSEALCANAECAYISVHWTLHNDIGGDAECAQVGITEISIQVDPAEADAFSVTFPCADGVGLLPKLPLGHYTLGMDAPSTEYKAMEKAVLVLGNAEATESVFCNAYPDRAGRCFHNF
jgi:hypothetical protein